MVALVLIGVVGWLVVQPTVALYAFRHDLAITRGEVTALETPQPSATILPAMAACESAMEQLDQQTLN